MDRREPMTEFSVGWAEENEQLVSIDAGNPPKRVMLLSREDAQLRFEYLAVILNDPEVK